MIHTAVFYYNHTDLKIHYSIKSKKTITCIVTKYVYTKTLYTLWSINASSGEAVKNIQIQQK